MGGRRRRRLRVAAVADDAPLRVAVSGPEPADQREHPAPFLTDALDPGVTAQAPLGG